MKKESSHLPYVAIVFILAIVAVVVLVLNVGKSGAEEQPQVSEVTDESGNLVGEAFRYKGKTYYSTPTSQQAALKTTPVKAEEVLGGTLGEAKLSKLSQDLRGAYAQAGLAEQDLVRLKDSGCPIPVAEGGEAGGINPRANACRRCAIFFCCGD